MPVKSNSHPGWWRFPAPSTLLLTALLFPLPWIEVTCQFKDPGTSKKPKEGVLLTQSGLQAATGSYSNGPVMATLLAIARSEGDEGGKNANQIQKGLEAGTQSSPILYFYAGFLTLAILLALVWPLGKGRLAWAGFFTGLALATLIAQTIMGFPLLRNDGDSSDNRKALEEYGVGPPNAHYTLGFYLTYASLGFSVTCLGLEALVLRSSNRAASAPPEEVENPFEGLG